MYNILGMGENNFLSHYQNYKNKIYTFFLYRVSFNSVLAEDLTSEVFLKALRHFDDFDTNRSFQAWIYRIAHNHLCNYYRACAREVELAQADRLTADFRDKCEASLELTKIIKAIYKLQPYFREALLLRFVDGLSNGEIANLLNKDEGAVRTQISRAIALLRKKIESKSS